MTADTYSNTLGVLLMGTGNDNNSWGSNANAAVFQILEDAVANALTTTVIGGTLDLSGSPPPAAASQVRYAALIFNGTLGSNQIVQVPNLTKFWFVQNATSGAFTLKFQTPAAVLSTAIPQNSGWQVVSCDGSNNIVVTPFNSNQIQMPDGTVSAPAYSNLNEPKSGWWRAGTQDWRLSINGVDIIQATGAGAASPSIVDILSPNVLQVNGGSVLSAGQVLPAGDGTAAAPGQSFNTELASGWYRVSLGDVGFSILQVQRLEVTSVSFTWQGSTYAGSDLSPAAISTNQNNYSPAGLGLILTLGSITAGSSYTNGTYTNVALTGGTGTGAKATVVVSGGGVTSVTLTKRGLGFVVADSLSASSADIGGTGSGFSVPVATVDAMTGTCLRLNVTATCSLTGIAGGGAGRELELVNVGAATLQCPANSGSSSAANRFANTFNLAPGQSITLRYDATSSLWRPKNIATAFSACSSASVSPDLLVVNHTGTENTKIDIKGLSGTLNEAVLTDSSGNAIKFESVSVTIDSTTTGANGCDTGTRAANASYFLYLISDGVSIAGMLSTSSTGPSFANAANYLYFKRVGGQFTNGSSNFLRIRQVGQRAQMVVTAGSPTSVPPTLDSGSPKGTYSTTTPTWAAVSVAGKVPSTASTIRFFYASSLNAGNTADVIIAPNNAYGGVLSGNPSPYFRQNGSIFADVIEFLLESTNIYWAVSGVASGGAALLLLGWDDSI